LANSALRMNPEGGRMNIELGFSHSDSSSEIEQEVAESLRKPHKKVEILWC